MKVGIYTEGFVVMFNDRDQLKGNRVSALIDTSHEEVFDEKEFINDFSSYYKMISSHCARDNTITRICQDLYAKATLPFVEKWKKRFDFIKLTSLYSSWPRYSFEIHLKDRIILVPHRIVVHEIITKNSMFLTQLEKVKTLKEFKRLFVHYYSSLNVKLNLTDVKIIRGLTSRLFFKESVAMPAIKNMAQLCGCPRQTFIRRLDLLTTALAVIYFNYRIDMGKLGYETFMSIVPAPMFQEKLQNDQKYCLAKVPFGEIGSNLQNEKQYLLISQIPVHKTSLYQKFITNTNLFVGSVSKAYIGWNLSTLTPPIKKRWSSLPPILTAQNWEEKIISANNGIVYDLKPQNYCPELTTIELKILGHFEKYGSVKDTKLAEKFEVSVDTIKDAWSKIIEKKLMHRFTFVSNIGLNFKPWITIIGRQNYDDSDFILNIVEHLKFFPFSYLFYLDSKATRSSRNIITGLIYMPSEWASRFFYKLSLLSEFDIGVQVNLSHERMVKQNINLLETYY